MYSLSNLKLTFANIDTIFINCKLNAVTFNDGKQQKKRERHLTLPLLENYFFANSSKVLPSKRQIAFL